MSGLLRGTPQLPATDYRKMNDELLYRYFRGEASPEEIAELREQLASDPAARREFDSAHTLFSLTEIRKAHIAVQSRAAKARISAVLRRAAVAAVSAAAAVLVGFISFHIGGQAQKDKLASICNVLEVPNGRVVEFALSDGTMVTLNGGSRLEYPIIFGDSQRNVRLSGQAKFSVAHDGECPFVVNAGMCDVTVLGTTFEVMSDPESGEFSASLFEGSVKVTDLRDNSCLFLKPNQMVYMKDNRLQRTSITDDADYLWTRGIISIANADFETLMARFERAFGVKIDIRCGKMPELNFISGKMYVCEGIENALKTLQKGCSFRYVWDQEKNLVVIE